MNSKHLTQYSQKQIKNELARRSLIRFVTEINPNYQVGWFNTAIANALMRFYYDVIDGKQPRLMIFAPPRSGKSELFSRAFPAWAFGKNPNLQMIASSYSSDLSTRMNRDVQRIMMSDTYADIFPETKLNSKRVVTVTQNALRNSEIFERKFWNFWKNSWIFPLSTTQLRTPRRLTRQRFAIGCGIGTLRRFTRALALKAEYYSVWRGGTRTI